MESLVSPPAPLTSDAILGMYDQMLTIRRFEIVAKRELNAGKFPGFIHMYVGEESIAVAACANLKDGDAVVGTHRSHGHCIAKGCDLRAMFAELRGAETGLSRGKGGSMHMMDVGKGMYGANGVVGGGFPMATGLGLGFKYKNTDNVSICFFGDGASNQGTFHESLNLAAIWKLPVVYICENNGYAEDTPVFYSTSAKNISDRAAGYSIVGESIDGSDIFQVYSATKKAIERARKGEGPTLIDAKCWRIYGHYQDDPAKYKTQEYMRLQEERDPVKRLTEFIVSNGLATSEKLSELGTTVDHRIDEALAQALADPMPRPEEALEDTYATY
ncbi:MAG: thiamine pyrophosphate-dependent dehydrogenase E1 component subunit alpha [Thaumarchaeota archaeon]|nr:thiamine pyrophosphate-dependent dehydrogenase E1 component subunit alpha [Nitrososphaerota archaeon]